MNRLTERDGGPVRQISRPHTCVDPKTSNPPCDVAPRWATELASGSHASASDDTCVIRSDDFTLLTFRVPHADTADGRALESFTESAYRKLLLALRAGPHPYPLRIWNFVPRILDDGGDGLDRYMRFNAGRHRAYAGLLGGADAFDQTLPAASAVGHTGSELVIHALASSTAGTPIANPRQCPPYRYSRRYGPLPPCFARATCVNHGSGTMLLIGGTASIRGEHSLHISDLDKQLAETRTNLVALLSAATARPLQPTLLNHLDHLRVYFPLAADLPRIRAAVEEWFPRPRRIEWHQAILCRAELLVEIEGRATL